MVSELNTQIHNEYEVLRLVCSNITAHSSYSLILVLTLNYIFREVMFRTKYITEYRI